MPAIAAEPIPIDLDAEGAYRVGGTRIPLETVISAYEQGWTPEEIVHSFPTLNLGDVYATVTYYLRHRAEVDGYLERQEETAQKIQGEIEAQFSSRALRERLVARLRS